jgi:diguanylate cyclase (GGDEF)-like protein/PAS domain S-box-containing protein
LTGFTLDEVRGKTPESTFGSSETLPETRAEHWQTILSGKEWHGEMVNRRKNGESYWVAVSISPIIDSNGIITHFVSINEDITTRKETEEKIKRLNAGLEQLAMTDYLTSLYNRRYFMQRGTEEFKRAKRNKQPLALLMLDIDQFKKVNDTYGHEAGDMALQQVASVLKSSLREIDILGRMGGEEFAVLLPNTPLHEAGVLAERVQQIMANTSFELPGASLNINITISIGVAVMTDEMSVIDDILRNADAALYHAKNSGRNRVIKYKNVSGEVSGLSSGLDDK